MLAQFGVVFIEQVARVHGIQRLLRSCVCSVCEGARSWLETDDSLRASRPFDAFLALRVFETAW